MREHEGTTLELIIDGCLKGFSDAEVDLMTRMSLEAQRPLNWNVLTVDARDRERCEHQLARLAPRPPSAARAWWRSPCPCTWRRT